MQKGLTAHGRVKDAWKILVQQSEREVPLGSPAWSFDSHLNVHHNERCGMDVSG